jgi:tetratricopeptide (TPR) repeat protein
MRTITTEGQPAEFLDAIIQRAITLYGEGQFNSADLLFATVAEEARLKPFVLHMRGLIARQLGFRDDARRLLRQSVEADPMIASAHANLGTLLLEDGHFPEALAAFAASLTLAPQVPESHFHLSRAFAGLGMADLAIDADRDALRLQPDFIEAEIHLSRLLADAGRDDEAVDGLRSALTRYPQNPDLHIALAVCLLTVGDWAVAWPELEWRWTDPRHGTDPVLAGMALWRGENLGDRTILLQAERNDADTILFSRYAPLVKARGGRVILRCPPPLLSLLETAPGVDAVVAADQPLPAFDLMAPLLSLPAIFRTRPDDVPAAIPYLHADPQRIAAWRDRAGTRSALTVGLSWMVQSPGTGDDRHRLEITALRPLLDCPEVRFVSLDGKGEGRRLFDPGIEPKDRPPADVAALIASLDLVIAVEGPTAHLAGALGKPVWILLPAGGDWRWLRDRADSPWYPQAKLFRQRNGDRWDDVVERVGRDLRAMATGETIVVPESNSVPTRQVDPVLIDALFAEGTRHHQAGAVPRARRLYQQALASDPTHVNTLCNLGALEQSQGDGERARDLLEHAVALAPSLAPAHAGLAMALRATGDFQNAMAHFQRTVEIDRNQPAPFFLELGLTLVALDRLEGAEVSLQHAVALEDRLLLAHCALGEIYLRTNRLSDAAISFRRALAIDAECVPARRGLEQADKAICSG